MTIVHPIDPATIHLDKGAHKSLEEGACLLEMVSYVVGERWSDHPKCVSPVIAAFGRSFNDNLDDTGRQKLTEFIPQLIGTNTGPADEQRRGWLIADWMTHVHLPTWLDAAGMADQAAMVRALPKIDSASTLTTADKVIRTLRDQLWALRDEKLRPLREAVRTAVRKALAGKGLPAVEAAVEAETAVETAVAAEAAEAAVKAEAAAVKAEAVAVVAVETAVETAAAAAVAAAAVETAVEAAEAAAEAAEAEAEADYWTICKAVYDAVYSKIKTAIAEDPTVGPVAVAMQASGFELLAALCEIGRAA